MTERSASSAAEESHVADALEDDPRVQRLYTGELGEFVAARTALAKEVGQEDKEAARQIKRLRKPTVAAWALNRVAQEHPSDVEELLQAGEAVRDAQERALGGDRGELRERVEQRRTIVRRLADEAVALSSDTHRDEIDATLEAASIDPDAGALLRRGVLTKTIPRPSGFGVLAGMELAAQGSTGDDDAADHEALDEDDDEEEDRKAREARERLEEQLQEAEGAVEASRTRLEQAEQALEDAQRQVADARAAAERDVEERDRIRAELADT